MNKLFCDYDTPEPEITAFLDGQTGLVTIPSHERETTGTATGNEDAAAIIGLDDGRGVLVVADGMGGHSAGARAAALAVEAVAECVRDSQVRGTLLRSAIVDGFELANERVQEMACGAGTTLAVAEIGPESIRPYHCGDSVLLVTGQRGKIKWETTSHSPVGYGIEAGFLEPAEAMHHEYRHLILNAVGLSEMRIEIGPPTPFGGRDTLLLASDGLTDNLGIDEIIDFTRKGSIEESLTQLTDLSRARMLGIEGQPSKPDDLTMLMFRRNI